VKDAGIIIVMWERIKRIRLFVSAVSIISKVKVSSATSPKPRSPLLTNG